MNQVSPIDDYVNLILRNLEKNGYPGKSVAFPLEKMYESASQKGFSFNKVRDVLKQKGVETELTEHKVIFSQTAALDEDVDMSGMAEAAQQMLQNMSPEQREQITQMMQNMGPEQLQQMQSQFDSMPADEKKRLMDQMKNSMR